MIRFPEFEARGARVAAFSEACDGDAGPRSPSRRDTLESLARELGIDADAVVFMKQVHGIEVARARASDRGRGAGAGEDALGPADALVTNAAGLPLAVLVADCVPIYLVDPVRRTGGIVHAGWRGTLDGAASAAVEALTREWGTKPEDVWALIGPSAGPCCYEVSEELAERFRRAGLAADGRLADLWESNTRQLEAAGLRRDRVLVSGLCTLCDGRFHSHRRDASGARNVGILVI